MSSKAIEIDADVKINEDGDLCQIRIESLNGQPLTPQDIVDSVVDLTMQYFSMSADDWKRALDQGLDS